MIKGYWIFIIAVLMISPVLALDSWGTGKQNQNFTITQVCNDATFVTLSTIQSPDKTVQIINTNMTSTGSGVFQYNFTETEQLGRYDVLGISDGCENTFSSYFEVTPSGLNDGIAFYILWLILSLGVIILGYYTEDAWIVILGSFGLVLFGLYVLFYGLVGLKDPVYTWGLGIITLMLGAYFGTRGSLENIK